MRRFGIVAGALTIVLTLVSVDLTACGDKFVRAGRTARFGGYASIHPGSILVYQPPSPNPAGVRDFELMLTRAGHTVTFLPNGSDVARAAGAAKYDLIVVTSPDVDKVVDQIRSISARPDIVPISPEKAAKVVKAQLKKDFHCVLEEGMDRYEVLDEIDHAMATRLKTRAPSAAPKPKK